jgi:hypothetical protein
MIYRIWDKRSRTYFKFMSGIGPCFGATKKIAARFGSKKEALLESSKHWGFVGTEIKGERK